MKTLLRLTLSLTPKGFNVYQINWNAEEKNKVYIATLENRTERFTPRHIKKEDIGMIGTMTNNNTELISFTVWTFEEQREELLKKMKELIVKRVKERKAEIDSLVKHIEDEEGN